MQNAFFNGHWNGHEQPWCGVSGRINLQNLMPLYNEERFIRRAASSVLKQSCADILELILVDDGSTDRSGQICDQISAEAAQSVRVFHQKYVGVSAARNLGIQEARGEYLAFLDADDWWVPDFFNSDLAKMLTEQFDVLSFSYLSLSPDCRWYKENRVQNIEVRGQTAESKPACPVTHWSSWRQRRQIVLSLMNISSTCSRRFPSTCTILTQASWTICSPGPTPFPTSAERALVRKTLNNL